MKTKHSITRFSIVAKKPIEAITGIGTFYLLFHYKQNTPLFFLYILAFYFLIIGITSGIDFVLSWKIKRLKDEIEGLKSSKSSNSET